MAARKAQQAHIRQPDEQKDIIGAQALAAGAKVYQTYCIACHQGDGKGDGSRFPPVAGTRWVSGNKQRLISVVLFGLSGEIDVEGKSFNGVMPAHGFLSDEQVGQLLTYLRQNFSNHAQGISTEEVADQRAKGQWVAPTR
jgi:mono/diheme cytochrome c family protein